MTPAEQEYADKHHCKRLTFNGVNDLYQTLYGARTITDAMNMDVLAKRYYKAQSLIKYVEPIKCSDELARRHEQSIDRYGISPYSFG